MFFYMELLQNHAEKSLPMANLHKSLGVVLVEYL